MKNKKGFTLIELVVVMGIFSFIAIVMSDILSSIVNAHITTESGSIVQQDSSFIFSRLSYDIARASSITYPAGPGDTTNVLTMTIDGVLYQYAINSGVLELTVNGSVDRLNNPDDILNNATFTRLGNGDGKDTVTFQFTVTSTAQDAGRNQESKTYSATVGMK